MSVPSSAQAVDALRSQLGVDVLDLGGSSNSRFAAKFGRSSLSTPGRLWDLQLARPCDVLGLDRGSGRLWLRYALSAPFRAVEVSLEPSALVSGRWEAL